MRARQSGNTAEVIAYADRANTRLRSRYYKLIRHGKKKNVAVAAVARELACFVWGMMTDNTGMKMAERNSMDRQKSAAECSFLPQNKVNN